VFTAFLLIDIKYYLHLANLKCPPLVQRARIPAYRNVTINNVTNFSERLGRYKEYEAQNESSPRFPTSPRPDAPDFSGQLVGARFPDHPYPIQRGTSSGAGT
jgi:hypothetical protein